jgi:hypothetical protein
MQPIEGTEYESGEGTGLIRRGKKLRNKSKMKIKGKCDIKRRKISA